MAHYRQKKWNPRTRELLVVRGSPEHWHLGKEGGQKGSNFLVKGTHGTSEKGLYLDRRYSSFNIRWSKGWWRNLIPIWTMVRKDMETIRAGMALMTRTPHAKGDPKHQQTVSMVSSRTVYSTGRILNSGHRTAVHWQFGCPKGHQDSGVREHDVQMCTAPPTPHPPPAKAPVKGQAGTC